MTRTSWQCLLGAAALVAVSGGTSANAMCQGKPQINLGDGSSACVVHLGATEFTTTASIKGAGPAAARTSKSEGGIVVLRMLNETSAKATTRNAIRRRARAVCASYKDQIRSRVARPSEPFMAVVFGWGENPQQMKGKLSPTHREVYLSKNCRVSSQK